MVKVREDMTGWVMSEHGVPDSKLKVLRQAEDHITPKGVHYAQWLCECSCEEKNKIIVLGCHLKNGHTQSCGCLQKERTGETAKLNNKKYNNYILTGEFGIGFASNTNKEFYFDLEDYDLIKDYCWNEKITLDNHHSMAARDPKSKKIISMHQLITGKKNMDHANRNACDNRKCNLREATCSQQIQNQSLRKNNTSGFIGVCWDKRVQKWMARISIDKKETIIGYFENKEDAIVERLKAEAQYYGDFAPQRHLFKEYKINNFFEISS